MIKMSLGFAALAMTILLGVDEGHDHYYSASGGTVLYLFLIHREQASISGTYTVYSIRHVARKALLYALQYKLMGKSHGSEFNLTFYHNARRCLRLVARIDDNALEVRFRRRFVLFGKTNESSKEAELKDLRMLAGAASSGKGTEARIPSLAFLCESVQ